MYLEKLGHDLEIWHRQLLALVFHLDVVDSVEEVLHPARDDADFDRVEGHVESRAHCERFARPGLVEW